MFKKLRNKLLLNNIILTTTLVLCCLAAIRIITAGSITSQLNNRLDIITETCKNDVFRAERPKKTDAPPNSIEQNPSIAAEDTPKPPPEDDPPPPKTQFNRHPNIIHKGFSTDFALYVLTDGTIQSYVSDFILDTADFESMVSEIISIVHHEAEPKVKEYGEYAYTCIPFNKGYIISFTENGMQKKLLFNLTLLLIGIGIAAILITFFISLYGANKAIKPIEVSYNKQKQFVADASHELRTPLAAISANADVLLSHPESTIHDERKWLEYIKDETERMTKLTNELLYLARLDNSDNSPILSAVSFSDIAEDTVLENEAVAFEKNIIFDYDIDENINVLASECGIKQLVLILIDNAVKYTPENGSISITLKADRSKAVFTVTNTGDGIAEYDLPHIFDRFYRTDKSRARESGGCGLGLAIAKGICESFGGTITAKSSLGGNTAFTVILDMV